MIQNMKSIAKKNPDYIWFLHADIDIQTKLLDII